MYDPFADTFAQSRKHMKWVEMDTIISSIRSDFSHLKKVRMLDVGCGSGRFLQALNDACLPFEIVYVGLDSSQKLLNHLHEVPVSDTIHVQTRCQDMVDMNFEPSSFDVIVFVASFHHLQTKQNRVDVLRKAHNILDISGRLFMTNWFLLSEENQQKYASSCTQKYPDGSADFLIKIGAHDRFYHGFTLDSLRSLFEVSSLSLQVHAVSESGRNLYTVAKPL